MTNIQYKIIIRTNETVITHPDVRKNQNSTLTICKDCNFLLKNSTTPTFLIDITLTSDNKYNPIIYICTSTTQVELHFVK